jgi:hypothetical protein
MTEDSMLTVEEFAIWQRETPREVRRRLRSLAGVFRQSREMVRIHPRTYLAGRNRHW